MLEANKVHQGLSQEVMQHIEAESIALSFWSPPYFVGKEYEKDATYDSWQLMLKQVIHAHSRILKPGGFMVINIADILCFEDDSIPRFQAMNLSLHKVEVTREAVLEAKAANPSFNKHKLAAMLGCSEQTIDRRLNGNNIRGGKYSAQTRVKLVGGNLEHYAYEAGLYLYDKRVWVKDPSWANSRWTNSSLKAVSEYEDLYVFWKPGQQVIDRSKLTVSDWKEWGSRGVWYIDSVRRNDDHEAKFPLELARRIVLLFSDKGDLVLDPFMGAGTTGLAAVRTGRNFIGIEKESKYVELASKNIEAAMARAQRGWDNLMIVPVLNA
jgi:site-specific DNA-methyltransferase (adenine-specific)